MTLPEGYSGNARESLKRRLAFSLIGAVIGIVIIAVLINSMVNSSVESAISKARLEDAAFEFIDICYNEVLYFGTAQDLDTCDADMNRLSQEYCARDSSYAFCSDATFQKYFVERAALDKRNADQASALRQGNEDFPEMVGPDENGNCPEGYRLITVITNSRDPNDKYQCVPNDSPFK